MPIREYMQNTSGRRLSEGDACPSVCSLFVCIHFTIVVCRFKIILCSGRYEGIDDASMSSTGLWRKRL